ncbi:ORM1-like protein 2 [Hordeum vulgare]|nr:ORM1-like protein 2 [Hordeum vulgare]
MAKLYVQAVPPPDLNKNTEWFMYPGVWTTYIFILFVSWLLILSIFGCTPGMAWTLVNLGHFAITYHFFHWKKGTPFADDQGMYNRLTWWEQMDNGKQLTRNRKFLVVVPVVLVRINGRADHASGLEEFSVTHAPRGSERASACSIDPLRAALPTKVNGTAAAFGQGSRSGGDMRIIHGQIRAQEVDRDSG